MTTPTRHYPSEIDACAALLASTVRAAGGICSEKAEQHMANVLTGFVRVRQQVATGALERQRERLRAALRRIQEETDGGDGTEDATPLEKLQNHIHGIASAALDATSQP